VSHRRVTHACRIRLRTVMMVSARSKYASMTSSRRSYQRCSRLKPLCQELVRSTCQRCPAWIGALSPLSAIWPVMPRVASSSRVVCESYPASRWTRMSSGSGPGHRVCPAWGPAAGSRGAAVNGRFTQLTETRQGRTITMTYSGASWPIDGFRPRLHQARALRQSNGSPHGRQRRRPARRAGRYPARLSAVSTLSSAGKAGSSRA
jgi:hypothetical protein